MKDNRQWGDGQWAGSDISRILGHERRVAAIRECNLFSDVFMSVALSDRLACQHVLRVVTGIKDLELVAVRSQYRVSKLVSHDAVLDILAESRGGKLYSLEIQRKSTLDHARRTRFYETMVGSEYLMKGAPYSALPDLCVVYISKSDLWKNKRATYLVEKSIKATGIPYHDGQQVLYVNAAVDDGSEIAELMKYFKTADPYDMSQGALSEWVRFLKLEEGGYKIMCKICDKIYEEGREEERKIWRAKVADMLADKDAMLADKDAMLADKDAMLAGKDAMLADKDTLIERLRALLAKAV